MDFCYLRCFRLTIGLGERVRLGRTTTRLAGWSEKNAAEGRGNFLCRARGAPDCARGERDPREDAAKVAFLKSILLVKLILHLFFEVLIHRLASLQNRLGLTLECGRYS